MCVLIEGEGRVTGMVGTTSCSDGVDMDEECSLA